MVRVKVCGITNLDDALAAVEVGAHALGFIFVPSSPRHITIEQAAHIISQLPPFVAKVGVFADVPMERVKEAMNVCPLDLAQLHGEESPAYCAALFPRAIKTFRVKDEEVLSLISNYQASAYLLDTFDTAILGGTGQRFDWRIAQKAVALDRPIILSGGLNPDNIQEAVTMVRPYGVDVSSGVEARPGKKALRKMQQFFSRLREVEAMAV